MDQKRKRILLPVGSNSVNKTRHSIESKGEIELGQHDSQHYVQMKGRYPQVGGSNDYSAAGGLSS